MSKSSFNIIDGIDRLLRGVVVIVFLVIIVKINEIGVVVIASLPLQAIASEVSLLATLETCIVSRIAWWSLSIGNISSGRAATSSASPIVRGPGSVNVHSRW